MSGIHVLEIRSLFFIGRESVLVWGITMWWEGNAVNAVNKERSI